MNWAFVDYENVGSLEALNLTDYERLFVFCGPKNTRLKFGQLPPDSFRSIELIGVATTGSNNLDFHLAFHLGRFHEVADKDVAFHIVSNDAGFNGLINHLKKLGRRCKGSRRGLPKLFLIVRACRIRSASKPSWLCHGLSSSTGESAHGRRPDLSIGSSLSARGCQA